MYVHGAIKSRAYVLAESRKKFKVGFEAAIFEASIIENLNLSKTPHWSAEHVAEFLSMLRNCSSLLRAEASQIASRAISDI